MQLLVGYPHRRLRSYSIPERVCPSGGGVFQRMAAALAKLRRMSSSACRSPKSAIPKSAHFVHRSNVRSHQRRRGLRTSRSPSISGEPRLETVSTYMAALCRSYARTLRSAGSPLESACTVRVIWSATLTTLPCIVAQTWQCGRPGLRPPCSGPRPGSSSGSGTRARSVGKS